MLDFGASPFLEVPKTPLCRVHLILSDRPNCLHARQQKPVISLSPHCLYHSGRKSGLRANPSRHFSHSLRCLSLCSESANASSLSIPCGTFCRQLLNNGKRLLCIGIARDSTDGRNDLVVRRDDECRTFRRTVTDFVAARILHRGNGLSLIGVRDFDIVGSRDFALLIRGHRQLAGAILRICREFIQALNAIERNADDRGACGGELVAGFSGKRVRLRGLQPPVKAAG